MEPSQDSSNAPASLHILTKPTGAICNLDCKYCFFLSKEMLYPGSRFRMADDTLREYIRQTIESQRVPEVTLAWQGGEPTLMGLDFLKNHEVEFNVLCTVHAAYADHPTEVYLFFRDDLAAEFIQFIPIIERATETLLPLANEGWSERSGGDRPLYLQSGNLVTERSVKAEQYGRFLVEIFEEWVRRDVGTVCVQMFDVTLGSFVGQHSLCIFSPTCGNALALEHTGDLYSCDHYVEPDFLLGNIKEMHILDMVASDQQRKFGQDKMDTLPRYCQQCDVRFACHGGCPRNRFINTPDGEPGLNYLCAGYMAFFRHVRRPMQIMANLLNQGRPPAGIMGLFAAEDKARMERIFANTGRNDPCPCGSGRKIKLRHGRRA